MSVGYTPVQWNRNKVVYDRVLVAGVLAYLALFVLGGKLLHPAGEHFSEEVLLLRALGTCAFLLLHAVLAIGPLARLDRRWIPLLYNRRHLGVVTFLLAALHGLLTLLFYGGFGVHGPLRAVLAGYAGGGQLSAFPFELLGFGALLVLFVMAATSHDFWLANLGSGLWKAIHMAVYPAYLLLVGHVALGALQSERSPALVALLGAGVLTITGLHLAAAGIERRRERWGTRPPQRDGWLDAGPLASLPDDRAVLLSAPGGERIAVFRLGDGAVALSNVCAHQGGPLGEGRVVDGCVTCPWHGWQYRPDTGRSPAPFDEQVPIHAVRLAGGRVRVDPAPHTAAGVAEAAPRSTHAAGTGAGEPESDP